MAWAHGGRKPKTEFLRVVGHGPKLGRADGTYIGVYDKKKSCCLPSHCSGHSRIFRPVLRLALRAAFGRTQS